MSTDPAMAEMEQASMAFLVALQRLTAAERAVLLLAEVFDLSHTEIAAVLGKNEAACRQLLRRARAAVTEPQRHLSTSSEEHRRLLSGFIAAARSGDLAELTRLLAAEAVLITDGGENGERAGRARNIPRPLVGARKIAGYIAAVTARDEPLTLRESELNGQPAILGYRQGKLFAAVLISVAEGRIQEIFIHANPARLR